MNKVRETPAEWLAACARGGGEKQAKDTEHQPLMG